MKTILALALLLTAILWTGCSSGEAAMAEVPITEPKADGDKLEFDKKDPVLRSVSVQSAERSKGPVLRLNGKIVWDDNVTTRIFSPFSGRVTKILVEAGQRVEE